MRRSSVFRNLFIKVVSLASHGTPRFGIPYLPKSVSFVGLLLSDCTENSQQPLSPSQEWLTYKRYRVCRKSNHPLVIHRGGVGEHNQVLSIN